MKAKRYTTEKKIRILRKAERANKTIIEVCHEKGISEQTFQTNEAHGPVWVTRSTTLPGLKAAQCCYKVIAVPVAETVLEAHHFFPLTPSLPLSFPFQHMD